MLTLRARAEPPTLSVSSLVSSESRLGTCTWLPQALYSSAEMTFRECRLSQAS